MRYRRRRKSGSRVVGSVGGDRPDRLLGQDDMPSVRRNIMTTPVAAQPRESGRHLWGSSRRNGGPQVVPAEERDMHGNGGRAGGDPSGAHQRCADPGGGRAPQGRQLHRPRHGKHARTGRRTQLAFILSGPVGDSGVVPRLTPAWKEADAITIPPLPAPAQSRPWKLSLRDQVAGAPAP